METANQELVKLHETHKSVNKTNGNRDGSERGNVGKKLHNLQKQRLESDIQEMICMEWSPKVCKEEFYILRCIEKEEMFQSDESALRRFK